MTDIQTILKMIETVDPNDTEKLDEIDARVWCYLRGDIFRRLEYDGQYINIYGSTPKAKQRPHWKTGGFNKSPAPKYTRSRDALKAIRPEGCGLQSTNEGVGMFYHPNLDKTLFQLQISKHSWAENEESVRFFARACTEELAELHAIVQAYEYERNKNNE